MKKYETMLVTSATLDEEQTAALVGKFKSLIEANGTLESVDEWGKRRLAYPINKEDDGVYTLFHFEAEVSFPAELERMFRITDGVLRSLIIAKTDEALAAEVAAKAKAENAKVEAAARAVANAAAIAAAAAARAEAEVQAAKAAAEAVAAAAAAAEAAAEAPAEAVAEAPAEAVAEAPVEAVAVTEEAAEQPAESVQEAE